MLQSKSSKSPVEKYSQNFTFSSEIPLKDEIYHTNDGLYDPEVEFSNISVLREEMMKG